MSSDTSNCKENNKARDGGAANDGNHHLPTPNIDGTTLAASATTLTTTTTTTTKDARSEQVYEDWNSQKKTKKNYYTKTNCLTI